MLDSQLSNEVLMPASIRKGKVRLKSKDSPSEPKSAQNEN